MTVGSDRYDASRVVADLGKKYEMLNICFKFYSSCRLLSATLEAAAGIVAENGIRPEDIKEVVVRAQRQVSRYMSMYEPKYMIQAQFCAPYLATMVLLGEPTGPNWFTEKMLTDPRVREFQRKIKVEEDPEASKVGWGSMNVRWNSTMEITTNEGKLLTKHVEFPRGEPENPFSPQDHVNKLVSMASWVGMKEDQIGELRETLDILQELSSISQLTRLLAV